MIGIRAESSLAHKEPTAIKEEIMLHIHRPYLFSHEWFECHATLGAFTKRFFLPLCVGAALVLATMLANTLESNLKVPLKLGTETLAFQPSSSSAGYLPDQFYREQKEAAASELPLQF